MRIEKLMNPDFEINHDLEDKIIGKPRATKIIENNKKKMMARRKDIAYDLLQN